MAREEIMQPASILLAAAVLIAIGVLASPILADAGAGAETWNAIQVANTALVPD